MFGIAELNSQVLLYLDIETLKEIAFINKQIYSILFHNEEFWVNKFAYDDLHILDQYPLFQEYIKVSKYRIKTEKILGSHYINKKSIEIKLTDISMLKKLLWNYDEQMKLIAEKIFRSAIILSIDSTFYVQFAMGHLELLVAVIKYFLSKNY